MYKIVFVLALFMTGELMSAPAAALIALPLLPLIKPLTGRKRIGKALAVLFVPCAAVTAGAVTYRLAGFIQLTSLTHTPVWVIATLTAALAFYLASGGAERLKRWAGYVMPVTAGIILLAFLLLAGKLRYNGIAVPGFFERNYFIMACEVITLLGIMPALDYREKPARAYISAMLAAVGISAAVYLLSSLILGARLTEIVDYPFYNALRVAKGGEVIGRMEALLIPAELNIAVLKAAACMTVIIQGIKNVIDKEGVNMDN
jgi:hypothetical protein